MLHVQAELLAEHPNQQNPHEREEELRLPRPTAPLST